MQFFYFLMSIYQWEPLRTIRREMFKIRTHFKTGTNYSATPNIPNNMKSRSSDATGSKIRQYYYMIFIAIDMYCIQIYIIISHTIILYIYICINAHQYIAFRRPIRKKQRTLWLRNVPVYNVIACKVFIYIYPSLFRFVEKYNIMIVKGIQNFVLSANDIPADCP